MGCWTHHNMWLLFIAGLQVGLLTALAPDSTCDPNTEFSCRNDSSICIALSRVKDGSPDCPDRSDEECNEEEFQCQNIHQCIPKERFHDGWPDCDDGSDEECGRGQFRCRCGVPHCIEGSKVKDGTKDCEDGSDEEKGQNKTVKCPDEGRLQDLLAVEKRRRKRQIHPFGTGLEAEDARTYEEKALFLQPSMTGSFSNNFQYSYTKFLNERLSREEYNPLKEEKPDEAEAENTETSSLKIKKTLSTRPFMVRAETDSYGSLNSGKIYQTAVNEPRSVFPSAESTLMKFDDTTSEKKIFMKPSKDKLRKINEYQPRRFTDLMLKIAALFQNESEINSASKKEVSEEDTKHKEAKPNKSRKLLSFNAEQIDLENKHVFKRSLQSSETEISHIPLVHSPTVPYVPQSNVHTTGIVMSTTGTDIIGGRTTEWTTIIEGTFISGTYAHIVHSTSRIYYTVDTSSVKTDNIMPSHTISTTLEKTEDLKTTSTVTNSEERAEEIEEPAKETITTEETTEEAITTEETTKEAITTEETTKETITTEETTKETITTEETTKETITTEETTKETITTEETTKETISLSQRINDKSLRALDEFINVLSSSKVPDSFPVEPTPSYSIDLDVIKEESVGGNEKTSEENSFKSSLTEPLEAEKVFNTLSVTSKDILDLEPSKTIESSLVKIASVDTSTVTVSSSFADESEVLSIDHIKNISLEERNPLISERDPGLLNLVGRMVGVHQSNETKASEITSVESTLSNNLHVTASEEILPTPTISSDLDASTNVASSVVSDIVSKEINESEHDISVSTGFSMEFPTNESLPSAEILKLDELDTPPILKAEEEYSPMETSLAVPDVTDLFAVFLPASADNRKTEVILSTESKVNSVTTESENIEPTLSLSVNRIITHTTELSIISNFNNSLTETDNPIIPNITSTISENESTSEIIVRESIKESSSVTDSNTSTSTKTDSSEVMVFLGVASTLDAASVLSSSVETLPTTLINSEVAEIIESESSKSSDDILLSKPSENNEGVTKQELNVNSETSVTDLNDMTVLLLPSMNLDDLKNFMIPSLSSSMLSIGTDVSEIVTTSETIGTTITPALDDSLLTEKVGMTLSEIEIPDKITISSPSLISDTEGESKGRAKRAVSESVTILRPEGRIVSTDALAYLTPVTHYTTYTYFTTIIKPGGGTQIRSSLHVDSVILEPTDRAVYAYEEGVQPCHECRVRNTAVHDDYETRYAGRPVTEDHYNVETVPYDIGRASEVTHRTTYTYYTTRFRGGTSFVETRKETKTDITPIPTGRYSPFEIGTYYNGEYPDPLHYHTEEPHIVASRPHDITHRTTYTYYTTRYRNGIPIVETRKVTDTNATPIPTYYRPAQEPSQIVRTVVPTHYQQIDPNLYKPDSVTHRTTYTYHTTRFRDGVPIVNTREQTETNVTPIPTYTRPVNRQGQTRHRVVASRPPTYNTAVPERYHPYNRQGSDPLITHRTTYTYFTTRLIGGSTHVDTRYVTETNITPNPTVSHVRGTVYERPHYDADHHDAECPVCRDAQRGVVRQPHNRVRARPSVRANRRTDIVDPEITPSTATLYSTYTYATTQLTRGGVPVVRTREHTVTEVLSDVVLPTLKFGDRIRSKRTVKLEDVIPKHTDHVVPIRHTFSRTNSYADGRQGRRIPINEQNQHRSNRVNPQRGHTPYLKKVDVRPKEHENSNRYRPRDPSHQNEHEIQPTSVTYYSTYTYFTTELSDGTPVTRSREHTVTEILTDVIVPTVSAVRRPHALQATRTYGENSHHRRVRDLNVFFPENVILLRRLLGVSNDTEDTTAEYISILESSKPTRDDISKDNSKVTNPLTLPIIPSSKYHLESSISLTPPLETMQFKSLENSQKPDMSRHINNHLKVIANEEDLMPAGAEIQRAVVATPVTHYTTFTYYTTKLKPGGSRIVETSTKVSSSITYPHTAEVYDREEYTRKPYTKRKLYANRSPYQSECCGSNQGRIHASPVSYVARTRPPVDTIYGLDSHAVRSSSNSYRRPQIQDYQRTCPTCNNDYSGRQNIYQFSRPYSGISRVQKDNYLTKVPVRNIVNTARRVPDRNTVNTARRVPDRNIVNTAGRVPDRNIVNTARRVPDRARNDVYYPDSNIKPTHVTYYSTYTYFTTEPVDGSSVVRSREHTVTEVLTDVIVPTVASLNHAQAATNYPSNLRHRSKRHKLDAAMSKIKHHILNPFHLRKLLSSDEAEIFTTEGSLTEENNFKDHNFTVVENIHNISESNDPKSDSENITVTYQNDRKNSTFLEKSFATDNTFEAKETVRSEIFNNNASQLFNVAEREFNSKIKNNEENVTLKRTENTTNFTLLEKNGSIPAEDIGAQTGFLQNSEIFNNDTTQLFEINNDPVKEKTPHLIEVTSDITDKTENTELNSTGNADFTKSENDKKTNGTLLVNTPSSAEKDANFNITYNTNEKHLLINATQDINKKTEIKEELKLEPSSSLKLSTVISVSTTITHSDASVSENTATESISLRGSSQNGFLYSTTFLDPTEPSFIPTTTGLPFSVVETPSIEKLELTDYRNFFRPTYTSSDLDITELLSGEDLDAEGAEVRHAIVATPTTHYTTYTYYSTVLQPGGKKEVITNTKITASTYYPNVANSQQNIHDDRRNERRPIINRLSKSLQPRGDIRATKIYEMYPDRAITRTQLAYPPSQTFRAHYKPSFATKVRAPIYETAANYKVNNKCFSCGREQTTQNNQYEYDRNRYERNRGKSYLTSIPVRRMTTQQPYYKTSFATKVRDPIYETTANYKVNNNRCVPCGREQIRHSYPNTIPYINPDIKPTRVTFYSTYTYFTTELQNGSPVVRSREHTVTEVLTDVIVPTVTSLSHARQTKYPSVRGKRDIPHYQNNNNDYNHVNSPFRRRLLSIDESDENIDDAGKLAENKDDLTVPAVSTIFDSIIKEDVSVENNLVASFSPDRASPMLPQASASLIEINDDFLSNAQFSKAFAAYLAFVESSGANAENITEKGDEDLNTKESMDSKFVKPSEQVFESKPSSVSSKSVSKSMISVLTSDVKRNGRMTKYTTTIYGTYINGVFAQRAESTSEIIPITEIDVSPATTLMFSPSRLPGLVRSIVSRKIRGPVAVHLTTEIHGTFVGGAYAQTARVFTSSQPLSSTREPSRHRVPSFTPTISSGTRKTGLLSTRVLRSKVDGTKTLLFVSEIYGTHIGGAYAHLGTYTTRTIIQTTSTTSETEPTSSTILPTYYMEDLSTGLVTESVSEKSSNGITTRFHYQVYGTYLDGTYAHVPSISTETLFPRTNVETSPILTTASHLESTILKSKTELHSSKSSTLSKPIEAITSKIGLIRASTRAHVINGTTTQHIFEVHGTFLNGNYAHVPSVSVITIQPSKTLDSAEYFQSSTEKASITSVTSIPEPEFEILTIFSSTNTDNEKTNMHYNEETIFFSSELLNPDKEITEINHKENSVILENDDKILSAVTILSSLTPNLSVSNISDRNEQPTNHFPVLLPEALRLSFSRDNINHRNKRNDPFSPYLRSSFTDSIKNQRETQHVSLTVTTPLPVSIFSELSTDSIKNASRVHSASKVFKKSSLLRTKYYLDANAKGKNGTSKANTNYRSKFFLKRSKRSPALVRTYGSGGGGGGGSSSSSKRFGSSASSTRNFSPSKTFKRDTSSASSRGYRAPSSRSAVNPTKSSSRALQTSKSVPNFRTRGQRTKPVLTSQSSSSVKPSSSSTSFSLNSARPRRFGSKKESDQISKMEEDFEASEAIPQSVTEEKLRISATTASRFRRPSNFAKLNTRSSAASASSRSNKVTSASSRSNKIISASSRSNKIISPSSRSNKITASRRSRMPSKNIAPATRKPKNNFRDYDYDIRPTATVETTSTKRRFTLTTTFEINLKSTAGYLTSVDDTDEGNNLQTERKAKSKQRNKSRSSSSNQRGRQGSSYKPVFDNDDNEVRPDKPKSLPLPVFGRSRGLKRPPKFDPRTIKATSTATSSTIIYLTPTVNETDDIIPESALDGPITVTDVFTTVKTLPVHLGLRTSFATITTTAFTTSTIQPHDLTTFTLGGITKTLLSAITGLPDANLPPDQQFTVITEIILTTTEVESTSLVAIKVGFGTRTDTIVVKQKMTTLSTQTNTIAEEKTASPHLQQQYPYFQNPFMPPMPPMVPQNRDFSLSLSENSFVSTQTITSTTVLPLFFNGKTILTTLTSTSLSEETLVKTTTFKVPQQPTMHPFIFPQPVFILPSVTTQITVQFTAHNGEVFSIVTIITVPLALNGHTRFARSVAESDIEPTVSERIISHETSAAVASDSPLYYNVFNKNEEPFLGTALQSSFSISEKDSLSSKFTETLFFSTSSEDNDKNLIKSNSALPETDFIAIMKSKTADLKYGRMSRGNKNLNFIENDIYHFRKLLQVDDGEEISDSSKSDKENINPEGITGDFSTQGSTLEKIDGFTYIPDTYHLIGPGFNEEGLNRPIPSVRVVPTRRSYVRRLNLSGSQNLPYDGNEDGFTFRRNNQNIPANINIPPGTDFSPVRPGPYQDENIGLRRNVPGLSNRPFISQDGPPSNFGTLRNVQYFSPNRPNIPAELERDPYPPARLSPNYASNRPNRIQDVSSNLRPERNFPPVRNNRPPQSDAYDAIRTLPNYTPTRQNVPPREEPVPNSNQFGEEVSRNQINRPQPTVTPAPRRVIRLRRPVNSQQTRPQSGREMLNRKPIVNVLPDEKESVIRARGPVVLTNTATIRDFKSPDETNSKEEISVEDNSEYTEALPLTYYTTFTYMTTFLNGPSTAYSTREAVVSNIATETLNPRLVGLIRSRGGFTSLNGAQTAVPLGSRAQGPTTTIVNLASRVQLYNSDVYYGRHAKPSGDFGEENDVTPTMTNLRTVPITDIASLPKTYYTLFTYFYTLSDGDNSVQSQRSETTTSVDTQTEPFILQDFASTIDSSGLLTIKPNKQIVKLGLRTAGGTTTEVNLELKTVVHIDGLKNVVIDRGSMTPTLVEVMPSETNSVYNNYLDPDDAEVQDQQTYPQTVPIQPSFSSANEVYSGSQRASSNREATPEIPSNSRIIRTQSVRGPLRVASTVLQRPGSLRSGIFAPRPGVRVRVRPASSRVVASESPVVSSFQPDMSSYMHFDSSRSISADENDFDEEDADVTEEDEDTEEYTTEEMKSTEEDENKKDTLPGRKRLKITIRRSPGVSATKKTSTIIRPTRTRPRFYVVTRTATPAGGSVRQPKRPVSVKVSRRLRPTGEPDSDTSTSTSVPIVFGFSSSYRNAPIASSSPVLEEVVTPEPSKTVILTYFTTTTYTVPYTVDGVATYTTLEETNSRIATETLDPDADLSFVSTTTLEYNDEISVSSADLVRQPPQTLKPQMVNNQLNVGSRMNLATKISNGVTLIVATEGESETTHTVTQPTPTLRPTVVTDALLITNKDITTVFQPRTFYTTFTFFTTFFSSGTPSISTSEQVITNVYSVPVTQSITRTQAAHEPLTVIETSENIVSMTLYTTHTFYATLFNGTGTIVTPIQELQSSVITSTETYTITKTIMPTPEAFLPEIRPTETIKPALTTTTSIYRTLTNYVTLFSGSESIVSPLEEIETDIITLTLDDRIEQPSLRPKESYTTRTIQATNTHYVTLFSGSESILSSITQVEPSVITELVNQLQGTPMVSSFGPISIQPTASILPSSSSIEPTFQDLVPSIRTQYTTLTYFTTLFTDSSTILSSREEVATSYITLFVPAPAPGATSIDNAQIYTSQTDILTYGMVSKSSEAKRPYVTPTSEILTFYTTYTYYTTLFRGTETIISDSETVVTQYVTIESTPTDSVSRHTTSLPPTFSRPVYSDSFEVRTEPTIIASPTFDKGKSSESSRSVNEKASSLESSEDDLKIIGVSTKVESELKSPSLITGIPSTDANGETHILFTDFIVPSSIDESSSSEILSEYITPYLPDVVSSVIVSEPTSVSFKDTTFFSQESSTPSSARDSASDLATTRLTDANVATHHIALHPTTSYNHYGPSQTMGTKPNVIVELSDVLTNTNIVGNIGEAIKDIVSLLAANGNSSEKISSKASTSTSDSSVMPPSGGITVSSAEEPVYIPIGAIARSTKASASPAESRTVVPILQPSTMLTGFTPIMKNEFDFDNRKIDSGSPDEIASSTLTSIVFGSNTIFIEPTNVISDVPATVVFSDMDGRFHSSFNTRILQGSESHQQGTQQKATPAIKHKETTSLITGLETIFFGFPDARQPPQITTHLIQGSASTSSIVGYETIFFDSPNDFIVPGSNKVNITGDTTIFGAFPAITESSSSSSKTPETSFTSTSSGETTIFFPVPGDNQQHNPGTRYVTSVESVTLTLTLTTSSVYQTEDTPVTVTSVFTTTIPPRTFVSTIIGDRTILGTQPEPTEAVQVIPTIQPSESTTTVTTTTLIFNSIATTVVRTLVIPTNAIQPTKPSTSTATDTVKLGGIVLPTNERPKVSTERTTPRKPIQLFKSGNRPTDPTTPKPQRTGPPLKLFPTKPSTTPTPKPPPRTTTTRKGTFRKPGKTLVPITDGCSRECNLKNKEVCKQNPDKSWSCQCRPGFFRKNGSEECKDVKSFVVLVRVLKMGDNEVTYSPDLSNHLSPEYKNLTTTARKAVDDAYKTSSVGDDFVSTNVLSVARDNGVSREGVLVNLTVQLSGEKPANEEFLKEELVQSLESSASEITFANASVVSPIIQRVEDVQDFDECYADSYNDCSRSAICINLPGTYTCECKDGYQDLEPLLPGRICSGEIKDCDYCNNRGVCIMTEDDNKFCRCYRMYLGKQCEINGLVLAIALPIALALLILTMFCLLCGCRKLRQRRAQKPKPNVFKGMVPPMAGTLDRKAMIMDSSSESSGEHRPPPPTHAYDGFGDDVANSTMKRSRRSESFDDHISPDFQMPTVLIPRAKHSHPKQVNAPYPNYRMPHGDMDRW